VHGHSNHGGWTHHRNIEDKVRYILISNDAQPGTRDETLTDRVKDQRGRQLPRHQASSILLKPEFDTRNFLLSLYSTTFPTDQKLQQQLACGNFKFGKSFFSPWDHSKTNHFSLEIVCIGSKCNSSLLHKSLSLKMANASLQPACLSPNILLLEFCWHGRTWKSFDSLYSEHPISDWGLEK
jgi:hypothetical protein